MSTVPTSQASFQRATAVDTLWNLLANPQIDPAALARAIETALDESVLDWRTLQLIKEGWHALEHMGGGTSLDPYLSRRNAREIRELIRARTSASRR